MRGFAQIAYPLQRLTEKDRPFHWNEQCSEAFSSLKARLVSAPVLAYPQMHLPFILDTDASDFAIGAVISQISEEDSAEHTVAYASQSLTKPERRYCTTRKELLAVVHFDKHFHHYLYGRAFVVRTDHGCLQWLFNVKQPEGQLACWLEILSCYDMTIIHRPGRSHGNADGMSRIPCQQCGRVSADTQIRAASYSQGRLRHINCKTPDQGTILEQEREEDEAVQ